MVLVSSHIMVLGNMYRARIFLELDGVGGGRWAWKFSRLRLGICLELEAAVGVDSSVRAVSCGEKTLGTIVY
jgi:hypothetical protein